MGKYCHEVGVEVAKPPLLATTWAPLCAPFGLSGFHVIILPAMLCCYKLLGRLPLEGKEGLGRWALVSVEAFLALSHFILAEPLSLGPFSWDYKLLGANSIRTPAPLGPLHRPSWAVGSLAHGLTLISPGLASPVFAMPHPLWGLGCLGPWSHPHKFWACTSVFAMPYPLWVSGLLSPWPHLCKFWTCTQVFAAQHQSPSINDSA